MSGSFKRQPDGNGTTFNLNLAITIGINNYRNNIAELTTARPDAKKLADLLENDYNYQVELITDETPRKPTLNELKTLLTKWLPEKLQPPAENNRLLFYFAGHGMPLEKGIWITTSDRLHSFFCQPIRLSHHSQNEGSYNV
jgi:hypothetical protein